MKLEEKLKLACEESERILHSLNIEYGTITEVTLNYKHPNWWGRCTRKIVKSTEFIYSIEINAELLVDNVKFESLMNTMLHEYLHCHEDRFNHTGEWKRCADLVNQNYPMYNVKRTLTSKEQGIDRVALKVYKYAVKCDYCGNIGYHKRAGKALQFIMAHPKNNLVYCCTKCGSNDWTVEVL